MAIAGDAAGAGETSSAGTAIGTGTAVALVVDVLVLVVVLVVVVEEVLVLGVGVERSGVDGATGVSGGAYCAPDASGNGDAGGVGVGGMTVSLAPPASSCSTGMVSPDSSSGSALALAAPHRSHVQLTESLASFWRSIGGYSSAPMAPSAGLGMNEISATSTVRTARWNQRSGMCE